MIFEVFCIDQKGEVKFQDKGKFLDALAFNEEIFTGKPIKDRITCKIHDENQGLLITIDNIDTTKVVADLFTSAFILSVEGEMEILEPLRVKLVKHLRDLGFNHIRILSDDVSRELSIRIYPLLNKIENLLRKYIVKFFISKIGLSWFDISVSKEVKDKLKMRKNNEPVFTKSSLVDTDVTLIDFNELGDIITRQTSVYSRVEDVIEKIKKASTLESLQSEIDGHYPKYFKTIFEKQNFESKWRTLFEIRNKIAHNNYIIKKDYDDSTTLVSELEKIIEDAEDKIDDAILDITEKQAINKAIQEFVIEQQTAEPLETLKTRTEQKTEIDTSNTIPKEGNLIEKHFGVQSFFGGKTLTEEIFLDEFTQFQKQKKPSWKFIAISKFFDFLERRNYNRQVASLIASILNDKGIIVIGQEDNPHGLYKTASIKLNENDH